MLASKCYQLDGPYRFAARYWVSYYLNDGVARSGYESDEEDDEYVAGGGEVFISGPAASNNPFAVTTTTDQTADQDQDDDLTPSAAVEFNPFATITDDQPHEQHDEEQVFDPFQTIHDDDALNVPFSSEDRDTEDDAASPSR